MKVFHKEFIRVTVTVAVGLGVILGAHGSSSRLRRAVAESKGEQDAVSRNPVKVLRVVSGDTVVILWEEKKAPVHLQGVAAPEKKDPRFREAVRLLESLIRGKSVEAEFLSLSGVETDDQERLIAHLFADGESVNEQMMEAGWSSDTRGFRPTNAKTPAHPVRGPQQMAEELPPASTTSQQRTSQHATQPPQDSTRVFIVIHDKTYHKATCRLLRGSRSIAILKSEAVRQGYERCKRCRP